MMLVRHRRIDLPQWQARRPRSAADGAQTLVLTALAGARRGQHRRDALGAVMGPGRIPPPSLPPQQPQMSNADRYAKGVDEFRKGQYEEALADLQQVNADSLSAQNPPRVG